MQTGAKVVSTLGASFFVVNFVAPEDRADTQLVRDAPVKNTDYLGMFFAQRASLAVLNGQGPVVPLVGRTVAPPLMTPGQMDAVVRSWERNLEGALAGVRDGSFDTIDVAEGNLAVAINVFRREVLKHKTAIALRDAELNPLFQGEDAGDIRGIVGGGNVSYDQLVMRRVPINQGPNAGINGAQPSDVAGLEIVIKDAIFELQSLEFAQAVIDKEWEGWADAVVETIPNIPRNVGEFVGGTLAVGGKAVALGIGAFLGTLVRELALPIAAAAGGYYVVTKMR